MKKVLIGLSIIFAIFIISGCVSNSKRHDLLNALSKSDIIKKDWKLIDEVKGTSHGILPGVFMYYYVYKDKEDKMYGIEISPNSENNDGTTKYNATVYYDIEKDDSNAKIFNKEELKSVEKEYRYSSDKTAKDIMIYKYNTNNKSKYSITYVKGFIFNDYQVIEEK